MKSAFKKFVYILSFPFILIWRAIKWPFTRFRRPLCFSDWCPPKNRIDPEQALFYAALNLVPEAFKKEAAKFTFWGDESREHHPPEPEISVEEEIEKWYRSKGKDATRSIYEMLADLLEEGQPYREIKNMSVYRGPYIFHKLKNIPSEPIRIRDWSKDPANPKHRKVRNEWRWKMNWPPLKEQKIKKS